MKKITILFIALALALSSCSSDDSLDISGDLVGTWIGVDVDYTGSTETTVSGEKIKATFVGEAYDVDYSLVFTENPNEVVSDGSYSVKLTTKYNGETEVSNTENLTFLSSGSWNKSGNKLTIEDDNETTTATILELTDTTLKIAISQTENISEQGLTFKYDVKVIATYIRQN
ncbi:lipocalin-like protein [Mariniflexile fucanivorans]|uniref:Lipocalin-like protein n=1 Tax=Mariniflexile fucanivorans TaxID=264023 RepID=A0A4R1RMP5_9FLAO|nr:lipocalin family protein [Mariniflexile fucanivorans]TCL67555.1 lipocalin-like protein [Mariniflexile fucanivorans]